VCRRASSGQPVNLYYSTSPIINQLYSSSLRMAKLSSIEQDDNNDGKVDRLELALLFPLSPDEQVSGFNAIVYHTVTIFEEARYIFDAMTYINFQGSGPISNIYMDGDLKIRQDWTFDGKGG